VNGEIPVAFDWNVSRSCNAGLSILENIIMAEIIVSSEPGEEQLSALGVTNWPVWSKEVSTFPWTYDEAEICFILEGEIVVTPEGGEPVNIGIGDLVTFPEGMSCVWEIKKDVRKHYRFG